MKPRVLHVVEAFCGGVIGSIATLTHMLSDDYQASIAHSTRDETPADYRDLFPEGTEFLPWPARRSVSPWDDLKALIRLCRLIRRVRPALIHAHSSKAGALGRLAATACRVPVIYSPRGYAHLQLDPTRPARLAYRIIEWALGKLPQVTVGCGTEEYGTARCLGVRNATIIANAVDVNRISALNRARRSGERTILLATIGRAAPQKNIQAFAAVAQRWVADPRVRFRWIGGRREDISGPTPPNLELTGWLPPDRARACLAEADVMVHLSLWEGLSIAILEAMSLSLPVIATPAPGNNELVVDEWNGFLTGEQSGTDDAVRTLIADPHLRAVMGRRGYEMALAHYDVGLAKARWSNLYRRLAKVETPSGALRPRAP